jgi:hypothetical protein
MIPVTPAEEPDDFDQKVRLKGFGYIENHKLDPGSALPHGAKLPPYWRECLDDLHAAYHGICAYACRYIDRQTGARSVDHYVAKSALVGEAYEWRNYRLACARMNARKRAYDDVLDPFAIKPDTFRLELVTGHVYANEEALTQEELASAKDTLVRLGLDDGVSQRARADDWGHYINGLVSADWLRDYSPFVWIEAKRQDLL